MKQKGMIFCEKHKVFYPKKEKCFMCVVKEERRSEVLKEVYDCLNRCGYGNMKIWLEAKLKDKTQ